MNFLKTLLAGTIGYVLSNISELCISEFSAVLDKLEESASKTPNPLDDLLVKFLRNILLIPTSDVQDVPTSGNFIYGLISIILVKISPKIRSLLVKYLGKLMSIVKATDNPYDDIFVDFLYRLFSLEPSD